MVNTIIFLVENILDEKKDRQETILEISQIVDIYIKNEFKIDLNNDIINSIVTLIIEIMIKDYSK